MGQIIINIFSATFLYLLLSISVSIEYYTTKFFNLFHAVIIASGAYFVYFFVNQLSINVYLALVLSVVLSSIIGVASEVFFYRYLRKLNARPFQLMIASLGLYIIFQNVISMLWGDSALSIRQHNIEVGHPLFGGYITNNQITMIAVSIFLFVFLQVYLKYSKNGKNMRAVASNIGLSNIFGINSNRVYANSYLIGSSIASVAGILIALETNLSPNMGFNLFLYGAIVMIIGGVGNFRSLFWGALFLAAAQNLGAYYISTKWMDAIAYLILILFLIWKPLGFSGKRLKKIEI